MTRAILLVLAPLLITHLAFPQGDVRARMQPVTSQVQDGGTYHVASRTWSRGADSGLLASQDVLYDNTCTTGYFASLQAGETWVDSGRLPSPSSPVNTVSLAGTAYSHLITGFQFSYCTSESPTIDLAIAHYNAFASCSDATALTPTSMIQIMGAPGSASNGSLACWIVSVDLAGSALEFELGADQDGSYGGGPGASNLGWSFTQLTAPVHGESGPLVAGDPLGFASGGPTGDGCPFGDGTVFAGNGSVMGTGLGTSDDVESHIDGVNNACWFGGYYSVSGSPYLSLHHELYGRPIDVPSGPGFAFCNGGTVCPCGNGNNGELSGPSGCANSNNAGGGALRAAGMASVSSSSLVLMTQNLAPGQHGLFFQGKLKLSGGGGLPFGDGLRCAGGESLRLEIVVADSSGTSITSTNLAELGGVSAGETMRYQNWYRNVGHSLCGHGFNLTNGYEITWGP